MVMLVSVGRRPQQERRSQTLLMLVLVMLNVAVLNVRLLVLTLLLARRFARRVGAVKRCGRGRDHGRHGRSNRNDVVDEQLGRVQQVGFGR